jgi:HK97 family phage prohead protease
MEYKSFSVFEFKAVDEKQGIFEAIVAVFGNVDRIGDKIIPGAFKNTLQRWQEKGRPVPVVFAHEWDNLDAHVGQVLEAKEVEKGLYVKAQLEMDEPFAQRVWKKMKAGTLAEFSFAYNIVKDAVVDGIHELQELELLEVGPCLVGMNPDTQLLGVKRALASHSTATSDAAWDGPANEARARSGENEAYYRRIFAWMDPEGDPTVKSTYKFVHHVVDGDGNPGAANIRGCQTGIGVLNGGRGGTTIPDADRQGVWAHLARHLRDADLEPPELKAVSAEGKAGARHTSKEYEKMQNIHDLVVELGAKCVQDDDSKAGADQGKGGGQGQTGDSTPRTPTTSTLAARTAIELLEMNN